MFRRRWLIAVAAVVAVVVGAFGGWWYWPRGDGRFVGTWVAREEGVLGSRVALNFRRNGTGRAEWGQFPDAHAMPFTWKVEGDQLVLNTFPKPFQILEIEGENLIRIRHPNGFDQTLRRASK